MSKPAPSSRMSPPCSGQLKAGGVSARQYRLCPWPTHSARCASLEAMSKVEQHRVALAGLDDWLPYLATHSGLPARGATSSSSPPAAKKLTSPAPRSCWRPAMSSPPCVGSSRSGGSSANTATATASACCTASPRTAGGEYAKAWPWPSSARPMTTPTGRSRSPSSGRPTPTRWSGGRQSRPCVNRDCLATPPSPSGHSHWSTP